MDEDEEELQTQQDQGSGPDQAIPNPTYNDSEVANLYADGLISRPEADVYDIIVDL
jgi:hypothetical protein